MSADWLINLAGAALIACIVWWFWLSRPKPVQSQGNVVEVTVKDGVYSPSRIIARVGSPITLRFLREDPSPCAEKVVFDQFDVSADLPVGMPTDVTLTPTQAGEYAFTCQMQMYRGTLLVKSA